MFWSKKPLAIPLAADALPGREVEMKFLESHFVSGQNMKGPYPAGSETIYFGMGCFWGAERLFWQLEGVCVTAVGYQGGHTPNPNYQEVCGGRTGHTEAVMVVYDPAILTLADLLKTFWQEHDPTQGMRQGNDQGTQYRSAIYTTSAEQGKDVAQSKQTYGEALRRQGLGEISTEIAEAKPFYFAEDHHQQYLAKNPSGYCGLEGTGVTCPAPTS